MLRTVLVLCWFAVFVIGTLPLFLIMLLYSLIDREKCHIACQKIVRVLVKGIRWLSGVRVTVKGRENIPENEAVLYVPNHRSYFDFIVTFENVESPVINIGKKELKYIPVIGQWIWLMGTLLLDRKNKKAGYRIIDDAVKQVKAGVSVFIYPEGTRNKGVQEEPLRFREGSLKISSWSHCKTVPVAILNSRDIYENHRPCIRPTDVTVVFGEPIDPATLTREELKNYGALTRERIVEMILKEEALSKGENE